MQLRQSNIKQLSERVFDVLVIGGGINGAVSAAALSARGVCVGLIEKGDFACSTSQESSNLIWGGLKYLQNLEFGLVRELCQSRNQIMTAFPSSVREIRLLASIKKDFSLGPFAIFLSTILYWLLGNTFTRPPKYCSKKKLKLVEPYLNLDISSGGFVYSDAHLIDNDARFVFNFIRSALDHGGIAANYITSIGSKRKQGIWHTQAKDEVNHRTITIRSKIIINACGPYVDQLNTSNHQTSNHKHIFSKGIHIIVPTVSRKPHVLLFFADDNRPFFVVPMGNTSCIGTTDTWVENLPAQVMPEDRQFLLDNVNKHLALEHPLSTKDIISERCGVRPLAVTKQQDHQISQQDWISLSRKHVIETDKRSAYISIYGGKLTDCINIGEEIIHEVTKLNINMAYPKITWYGEPQSKTKAEFFDQALLMKLDQHTQSSGSAPISQCLWRRYGSHALSILEDIRQDPNMAEAIVPGTDYIYGELYYAARREMVIHLEDFLRRRSHIALVEHTRVLKKAAGIKKACQILFGGQAQQKFNEYFSKRNNYSKNR